MNDLRKEDGYILVVVIGMLTILSLMTITFATLSRIETRAARNYTDSVKCEMVAKAGLEHALYIIRYDKFGSNDVAYDDHNSEGDTNYDLSGDNSWPGNAVFPGSDYDNDGVNGVDSKWIYFPAATSTTSAIRLPGNLLARYAVLITDDKEARVNINVTGNKANGGAHTSNEGWSTFEIDLSYLIEQASGLNSTDGDNIASDIIDARLGADDAPGTSTTNDDTGIVPDPITDNIDNDGDWDPSTHDTNGNGIPDSVEANVDEAGEATDEPNEFNAIFRYDDDVPFGLLTEAEIMGTSSYESRLEEIFNNNNISEGDQDSLNNWLTTYSADSIVCTPYALGTSTATTMLNINALINNGAYTDTQKVEMIMDVLSAGGITGSSAKDIERHQLAVNIKDFIDSDDTVTIYNDVTDDYYGVERTPYINEVEANTSSDNGKFIELFNPYDTDISLTSWTITGTTMPQILLSGTIGSQTYYVISDSSTEYVTNYNYNNGADADLYDINVNSLTTSGEILTLSDADGNPVQVTDYGNVTGVITMTRQLNDPRPIPLTASSSNPWEWTTGDETAGEENQTNVFNPGDGSDGWSDTIWKPSFLIANRRFSNIGYLGFIHRGSEWSSFLVDSSIVYPEVLNYITITDLSMDNIDNDGDGSTDSSDTGSQAGDFDGQEYRILGLINVNTAPFEVLQSLPDIGTNTAKAIAGEIPYVDKKPFTSIGDLVDKVTEITGSGTKWDKEKPFRSISNLITTRSNVFTVYVTAQITDEGETEVFAEKRILAIVDRSVNPIKVRYFRWIVE